MIPTRATWAEIHLDCLEHNINLIRQNFPKDIFLCPMIKANAYGHDANIVGDHLEKMGIKHLGVCLTEEGVKLRERGIKAEIIVFRGFDVNEIDILEKNKLTPVITNHHELETITRSKKSFSVHVKFNTGMNRLGFEVSEAKVVAEKLRGSPQIKVAGVYTHLAEGEKSLEKNSKTSEQLSKLSEAVPYFAEWKPIVHALNSDSLVCQAVARLQNTPEKFWGSDKDWGLRPGISIYGYGQTGLNLQAEFRPVMSFKSKIHTIRHVPQGTKVSYGGTWQAAKDSIIGVVPAGYADGVSRSLSNSTSFLVNGFPAKQVGRVCMDFLMLDLTDLIKGGKISEADTLEVTLFGWAKNRTLLSAETLAKQSGTISYEILTSVSDRVPRIVRNLES